MTTFVLVHGAWHGGWCWEAVSQTLRAAGHDVVAPTLTGSAERRHLLDRSVGLEDHVRDTVRAVEEAAGTGIVLVGHSYAGMVVVPAAGTVPGRLAKVVVVDGFLPERGETAIGLLPERAAAHYRDSAAEVGEGWWIPPRPLANLGVTDTALIAAFEGRMTPHPLKTYTDPATHSASELTTPGHYVLCAGWATPFGFAAERAARLGWAVSRLPADHEAVLTAPDLLAKELLAAAADPR